MSKPFAPPKLTDAIEKAIATGLDPLEMRRVSRESQRMTRKKIALEQATAFLVRTGQEKNLAALLETARTFETFLAEGEEVG